jgi:Trk K+ transport system NAD-binding subunit
MGDKVVGVDFQRQTVDRLRESGRQVIHGSATDPDFWERVDLACNRVKLIMLAMPNVQENSFAAEQLKYWDTKAK